MNYLRTLRSAVNNVASPIFRVHAAAFSSSATPEESSKTGSELLPVYEPDKLYKRLELEMRGLDEAVLRSYTWFCTTAASHLGIDVGQSWSPRKAAKERFTLLKSVHIYKKHKVQYEIRTYFRFLHLHKLTGSTCDTYLEYIERNLPEGCALKVTRVELMELPDHLKEKPENN